MGFISLTFSDRSFRMPCARALAVCDPGEDSVTREMAPGACVCRDRLSLEQRSYAYLA